MNKHKTILFAALILLGASTVAQQKVGVNTTTPDRSLEVSGSGPQHLRLHSTSFFGNEAGLELLRGDDDSNARDWKVTNDAGLFRIVTGTDNFNTAGTEMMRIHDNGFVGIGISSPVSRLHVDGGEPISETQDGYLLLGQKTGANLAFSTNQIGTRNNGNPASLYIQGAGGNTSILSGGTENVFIGLGGGKTMIGGTIGLAKLNVEASDFQIYLRNQNETVNDWYIGTSDASWLSGDDQLIFSPTSSSADGILRLMDVSENDGVIAPVMIYSGSQALLLDGNEIESKSGALYINHNSDQNTYLNPSGGKVGIGTTNPYGKLHVYTNGLGLGLRHEQDDWYIAPSFGGDVLFTKDDVIVSLIELYTGNWVALSDARFKHNVSPMAPVSDRLKGMSFYSYELIHDPLAQRDLGVMAQDLEPLFPEVVSKSEGQYGVAYHQLSVIAIKGIQEQQAQLESIEKQLEGLERID